MKEEVGREGEIKEGNSFPETLFKVSALARGNHQLLKYNHHRGGTWETEALAAAAWQELSGSRSTEC